MQMKVAAVDPVVTGKDPFLLSLSFFFISKG